MFATMGTGVLPVVSPHGNKFAESPIAETRYITARRGSDTNAPMDIQYRIIKVKRHELDAANAPMILDATVAADSVKSCGMTRSASITTRGTQCT